MQFWGYEKPKVEGAVLLVERWILARLRNRRFFALAELDAAIAGLVTDLNQRAFKKLPGCRADAFRELDAPALTPLPTSRFQLPRWKTAKVNIDYHVEFDEHYYSVPHRLVGSSVEVRVVEAMVEIFHDNQRVACNALSSKRGKHTTAAEHMPASHRAHLQWTPSKLIGWGRRVGVGAAEVVRWQLESRPHPEQGYRACLGLKRLAREYGPERLEAACTRALAIRSPTYASVASILKKGLDRQPGTTPTTASSTLPEHENVRGADYYH